MNSGNVLLKGMMRSSMRAQAVVVLTGHVEGVEVGIAGRRRILHCSDATSLSEDLEREEK